MISLDKKKNQRYTSRIIFCATGKDFPVIQGVCFTDRFQRPLLQWSALSAGMDRTRKI
jgi:hypothetical protein